MGFNLKIIGTGFLLLIIISMGTGCVSSSLKWDKVQLSSNTASQILNLRNSGQGNIDTLRGDHAMKNGFLAGGEEYGYYTLNISGREIRRNGIETWDSGAKWAYIIFTTGIIHLLGVPYGSDTYELELKMDILDSNYRIVKSYSDKTRIKQIVGVYYADATYNAGRAYSRMLKNIQQIAARDSEYINMVLQAAGPVNRQVTQQLRRNDISGAVTRASNDIISQLQRKNLSNSRLAIVNVSSSDRGQSEFVVSELELIFVSNDFFVASRRELNIIMEQQQLQLSLAFNDDLIARVGKLVKANIVITGEITGSGSMRRLRLRALDSETGQMVAVSSEEF